MTDKEKLEIARTALRSLGLALDGLYILLRGGNKVTVLASLNHLSNRCKEILEKIK